LQKLFVSKSSHVQVTFFSRYFGLVVDHGLAVVDRREGVMSLLGSADARTVERRIGLAATFDLTSLDLVGPAKPHLARSLLLDVEDRSNSAVVAAIEECCKASGRKFDIRKVKASRIEHRRFPGIETPEAEYPSGFLRVRAFRDEKITVEEALRVLDARYRTAEKCLLWCPKTMLVVEGSADPLLPYAERYTAFLTATEKVRKEVETAMEGDLTVGRERSPTLTKSLTMDAPDVDG
jgi:hypothetical protein